jgi:DNA-binding CsgD family transcriptional regulator
MKRKATRAKLTVGLMATAGLFFFQDVIFDVRQHLGDNVPYSTEELLLLLFEAFAVLVLVVSIKQMSDYTRHLQENSKRQQLSLYHLRQDFDDLVQNKFEHWQLTQAEADVTLLVLRGLTTEQIAELRGVAKGTVKVQAHNAMQKAGVGSRVELMSIFLEEFMDVALKQTIAPSSDEMRHQNRSGIEGSGSSM